VSNTAPYEIVAAPFEVYTAPVGTAFPAIDEDPTAPWVLVGTSGDLNYTEDGVSVKHKDKVDYFKPLGSTAARKSFRTEEEISVGFKLADISLEQYANALNYNTVSTTPAGVGTAGYKTLGLTRGLSVAQRALLVRGAGASPYGADWTVQYEIPVAVQVGDPEAVYTKGKPAALALEFMGLEDPDATSDDEKFGRLVAQHTEPGT